jgi:hypothetical protein
LATTSSTRFGKSDIPSPTIAVEKLCDAVRNPQPPLHWRRIPKLRLAITDSSDAGSASSWTQTHRPAAIGAVGYRT